MGKIIWIWICEYDANNPGVLNWQIPYYVFYMHFRQRVNIYMFNNMELFISVLIKMKRPRGTAPLQQDNQEDATA